MQLSKYLKVSRPGLWFPTIWIYILPASKHFELFGDPKFLLGLFFVTFPLNFIVYGMNDIGDFEADKFNKRKGNFLFGAKLSQSELSKLWKVVLLFFTLFTFVFSLISGWKMFLLFLVIIVINYIYNFKPFQLKSRPPLEIFIQAGYILTAAFSILLNDLNALSLPTIIYLFLFAFQAHIAGELMDIEPDLAGGKKTTATLLGRIKTKLLITFILFIEVYLLFFIFQDYVLGSVILAFIAWMLIDMFLIFKNKAYTLAQMKLFGIGMNLMAFASMVWILMTGKLL